MRPNRCSMNNLVLPPLILLATFYPFVGLPDEAATKGQAVLDRNQQAVVTVRLGIKVTYSKDGQSSPATETKYRLTGTVLDPTGLTVVACSGTDPAQFYKRVMPGYEGYKVESEIMDVKIILAEKEVSGEIVMRDQELDLAFVRPKVAPASALSAVDFGKAAPAKVLEQVIMLNRLNQVSGSACSASVQRVIAVVKKPRTFYLHDAAGAVGDLGSPVFSLNGDIIGVLVMRVGSGMEEDYRQNAASIIIPASEVDKVAKQVPPMPASGAVATTPTTTKDKK
jgi:S1-C subfamily serine protease